MNGSVVEPIGGRGYNKDGIMIASANALDARRENINPSAVQAAVSSALAEVDDQINKIMHSLQKIYGSAGFILNDVDLFEPEENMEQAIKTIPGYIKRNLDDLVTQAENVRNSFQLQYNNAIRDAMSEAKRNSMQNEEENQIQIIRYVNIGGSN